ncbi:MAG: YicC/YloC family endoribonuclease [Bacteroidota bacterium]
MIHSMTGFGKASAEIGGKKITVEIRSLNSKQLDLNMRLSSYFRDKENEIRQEISRVAGRGKVDFAIYSEQVDQLPTATVNRPLARTYYRELSALAKELKLTGGDMLGLILKMPDVFKTEKEELSEKEWKIARQCISKALAGFARFRADEGKTLGRDLSERVAGIRRLLDEVEQLDIKRIPAVRERLRRSVEELREKVDENRFEQELVYYIEKLDITEEKVRLRTHCDYFIATMKEESPGRKLGFISQEIGREINTIGSKANDAGIQQRVVQMKDELEKIKEQLNNVL